jgi:inositol transport system permease protein
MDTDEKKKKVINDHIVQIYNNYGIILIMILLLLICSLISPVFLSQANIINLLSQIAVVTIISCGVTLLIIAGQIDLSGGSIVALTGCVCMGTFKFLTATLEWNDWPAALISVLLVMIVGMIVNCVSGSIIAFFKVPAFIVTLALMQAGRGICYIYTDGNTFYGIGIILVLGQGRLWGIIPYSVIIMFAVIFISWFILKRMRLGRYLYAIGGNQEASTAAGLNTKGIIINVFMIHGAFVGIAGVLFMTRINSGQPSEAVGLEFDAITAAVIGGASLSGGEGGIVGTIIGSIIIGVIFNILTLKFVQSYYQMIITGSIIVLAVILDIMTKGKNN